MSFCIGRLADKKRKERFESQIEVVSALVLTLMRTVVLLVLFG